MNLGNVELIFDKMNLSKQIIEWLSDDSIDTRTLIQSYHDYIQKNADEIASGLRVDPGLLQVRAELVRGSVIRLFDSFLEGRIYDALEVAKVLLANANFIEEIPADTVFFRARGNDEGYLYKKQEMFHIPFDKRGIIGNQRYSISGVPCLYLGGSAFICWEELNRPLFQTCNFSGFKNKEVLHVYNLCLPSEIRNIDDVERIGVILACSLHANSKDVFKEQYILPQCLLQYIINEHYGHEKDEVYGIKYVSTHIFNNQNQMFECDLSNEVVRNRFTNYVFPSICSNTGEKYSPMLTRAFEYTDPRSYTYYLIKNDVNFAGGNNDSYLDSIYGYIEHKLQKELGIKSHWRVAPFLCAASQEED